MDGEEVGMGHLEDMAGVDPATDQDQDLEGPATVEEGYRWGRWQREPVLA